VAVPLIELKKVTKRFGDRTILNEVDLTIYKGEVTTIIGKSGVGKSVLLKHIIGLLKPDSGEIYFNGVNIAQMTRHELKQFKQKISYMFQSNALFDSLTVFENIALPLREKTKLNDKEIKKRVMAKVEQLELQEVTNKYPSQISGGMQKRVALARALINEPEIVLFDEPTTGLDPLRKNAVLSMISHYQRRFGFTAIMVSHDIPDVFFISNRVAIIDNGKIIFQGTPIELEQSDNQIVQQFIRGEEGLRDALTGLNTKRNIEERLKVELSRMSRYQDTFTIVLFEIKNLQQVTQHVGHIAAHKIVQCLANLLKDHFGTSGISARYGPNEVLTVLPHKHLDEAQKMLDELSLDLREKAIVQASSYPSICFNFSILAGLSEARSGISLDELISEARRNTKLIAKLDCKKGDSTP